jgi:hypothetical protein
MGFQTAEALTRIFPELARLVLPQGVVDIYRNIPPNDVPLIGSTSKVLVRSDLHPEIVQLVVADNGRSSWWGKYLSARRRVP